MTFDELIQAAESRSASAELQAFARWLENWRESDESVETLRCRGDDVVADLSHDESDQRDFSALWSSFVKERIEAIHGMTMNERLSVFGLAERFDRGEADGQARIYSKVLATF